MDIPRIRGGEPIKMLTSNTIAKYSPHTRG